MRDTPRDRFVSAGWRKRAYDDTPLPRRTRRDDLGAIRGGHDDAIAGSRQKGQRVGDWHRLGISGGGAGATRRSGVHHRDCAGAGAVGGRAAGRTCRKRCSINWRGGAGWWGEPFTRKTWWRSRRQPAVSSARARSRWCGSSPWCMGGARSRGAQRKCRRIGTGHSGRLAQLVRAPALQAGSSGFETLVYLRHWRYPIVSTPLLGKPVENNTLRRAHTLQNGERV
jgi:hypothetical protein